MKLGSENPPSLFFLFKIVLDILGPLNVHIHFRIGQPISSKKSVGIVPANVLNFQINLENTGISTILSFPFHEHETSIYLDLFKLF